MASAAKLGLVIAPQQFLYDEPGSPTASRGIGPQTDEVFSGWAVRLGEAGPEAVLPLETLWKKLDEIADRIIQSGDRHAAEMYEALITALGEMSFIISDREFARLLRKFGAIK